MFYETLIDLIPNGKIMIREMPMPSEREKESLTITSSIKHFKEITAREIKKEKKILSLTIGKEDTKSPLIRDLIFLFPDYIKAF